MPVKKKLGRSTTPPPSASATVSLTPVSVSQADGKTPSPRKSSARITLDGPSTPSPKATNTPKRTPKKSEPQHNTPASLQIDFSPSQSPIEVDKKGVKGSTTKRKRSRSAGAATEEQSEKSLILSLDEPETAAEVGISALGEVEASPAAAANGSDSLEGLILRTKVIAPDISGISCVAVSPSETAIVVARENSSLVLYRVEYHQSIPHFVQLRHTGGRTHRTITHLEYVDFSAVASAGPSSDGGEGLPPLLLRDRFLMASFLSGQLVLYDSQTLFPVMVHQRTGGAIWDFTVVGGVYVLAAIADGSWHQLKVHASAPRATGGKGFWLELQRIIPAIPGADRALSVAASLPLRLAVGTDNVGDVYGWRLELEVEERLGERGGAGSAAGLHRHESLWTTRLPTGLALCVAIVPIGPRPTVGVGTSTGDVVLFDASHGAILCTFSHHKGPVSTILSDGESFYASGWHESLRSYRCGPAKVGQPGEWYPAEVKRRTHYHEASQLALLRRSQLLLSASRDGTLMFAPLASVFHSPGMYVNVTTQQFAFARAKNILLQSRLGRVEAFRMDAGQRHWVPLFAQNIRGSFHLSGLWCDAPLHFFVFATDERVGLCQVRWRKGAEAALAISRVEEVLELPAERGLLDACFAPKTVLSAGGAEEPNDATPPAAESGAELAPRRKEARQGTLYLLFDDRIVSVTLAEGFPAVHTHLYGEKEEEKEKGRSDGEALSAPLRPRRLGLSVGPSSSSLLVWGDGGVWRCELTLDGTPRLDGIECTITAKESYRMLRLIPTLHRGGLGDLSRPVKEDLVIGLSAAKGRYVCRSLASNGTEEGSPFLAEVSLPNSLPHDVVFVAAVRDVGKEASTTESRPPEDCHYLGYFSRGLIYAGAREWKMIGRMSVEAAFVMKDDRHVLVLERNLAKALEALPMCWKVRRFGN